MSGSDFRKILAEARLRWAQADLLAINHEATDFGADLTPEQRAEHAGLMSQIDELTSRLFCEE
jgi:hypothetical protein